MNLLGLIVAFPQIVTLIAQIIQILLKVKSNLPGFITQSSGVLKQVSNASTDQEHQDAAIAVQNLIRSLHSS